MMRILALDLGTKTGVAWNFGLWPGAATEILATAAEVKQWGKTRMTRRCDPRIERLYRFVLATTTTAELVVFEDVEFSTYTKQTQLWASFRTAVWLASLTRGFVLECVPATTLKKFATGSGSADKAAMKRALFTQFPQTRPGLDDNAIDAMWILKWAEKNLSRAVL